MLAAAMRLRTVMRLQDLPPELQAKCLAYVSARERVRTAACVCRAWRRIVFGSSLLWPRMELWLASGKTMRTGRYQELLEQLRCMGETTAELELVLRRACTPTGGYSPTGWMTFVLQELLAAFPRLRALRLIQLPSASDPFPYRRRPAPGLTPAQLDALCQSCPGLVELGLNPMCGSGAQLEAAVARLQRLPHLRRLLLTIDFEGRMAPSTSLLCLSSLTKLRELRCAVDNRWQMTVPFFDVTVSGLINLQALELAGVRWREPRGPGQGLPLPPGLTRLSLRAPSWRLLLPMVTALSLQSLSVWLEEDVSMGDLGSVTCLTQLTQLQLVTALNVHTNPAHFGGGLVLPKVQRLKLCWRQYTQVPWAFPPDLDASSLGSLTYLCLQFVEASYANANGSACEGQVDFRPFARLRALVLQGGARHKPSAMRFPRSLTGLCFDVICQHSLPEHLPEASGLRRLIMLGCPAFQHPSYLRAATATLRQLTSLTSFTYCLDEGKRNNTGEYLPGTVRARSAWEDKVERSFQQAMPWLGQGACVVHWSGKDSSGEWAAGRRQQGDPDDLQNLLRVQMQRQLHTPDWL